MEDRHFRRHRLGVAAIVAILHGVAYWLLVSMTLPITMSATSADLELVFIPPPSTLSGGARNLGEESGRLRRRPHRSAPDASPERSESAHDHDQDNAIHPPVDWAEELSRAAKDAASASAAPQPRDFGFPHPTALSPPKAPGFGWSHARTHRVESIPGGGLLVNVNDRCILVFAPLPMFFCAPGKSEPNGELFEHMHDPAQAADGIHPK